MRCDCVLLGQAGVEHAAVISTQNDWMACTPAMCPVTKSLMWTLTQSHVAFCFHLNSWLCWGRLCFLDRLQDLLITLLRALKG